MDYKNQFCLQAKRGYYGGFMFVKWNTRTKKFYSGNTASTAVSNGGIVHMCGVTNKEVRSAIQGLINAGYKEHQVKWNQKIDTYESIQKAGL